ncbi:hypothetical protein [Bradyrhizobium elkanii]|uniref:hypothetical protein n=1 Tax=Bradyrhizobium elkanii TaxID=29448 RepID=UPI0004884B6E|nr:hypothetical protein [Bradyrhizobium elkanii]
MRDGEELGQAIATGPISGAELLEMIDTNCTYEEAKARSAERTRINALAEKVMGRPVEQWPAFEVVWTDDPARYYWTFDGADPAAVNPDEYRLGAGVDLAKIDAALTKYWHRRADEVWTVGDPRKAARIIIHWSEGVHMTPAMVVPTADSKNLTLAGGNHRLAVARAKGVALVPILFRVEHEEQVLSLLGLD